MVDRLESLLNVGWRIPFLNLSLVDRRSCLDVIDQMRISIPDEVKQAKRVIQDRERIIAQAQAEAEKIVTAAQEQAAFLLQEKELTKVAESKAQEIIEEARARCAQMQSEADRYAVEVLVRLEEELNRQLVTARKGIEALKADHQSSPH